MSDQEALEQAKRLAERYRDQCLWFCRRDFPATVAEAVIALGYIQRHGDREAFRQAGLLKQWLLPNTSERSAAS